MSGVAYIFPGQGSQYVGMASDLHRDHPAARELFDAADGVLGFPLSEIMFRGPEEELKQTKNTQPAIFLHSVAAARIIGDGGASMAAGHSLGEYSALVFAGAMTFEDGLRLVRLRGELMQRAGEENSGTMAAIVGLDPEAVGEVCRGASREGIVQPANFNSPGQVVISGSLPGVRKAMDLAKQRGARLVKELVVSGAFHSPLMKGARDGLREALVRTPVADPRIPVYTNVSAGPVSDASALRAHLEQQLTSPVRWEESVANMVRDGASRFVEVGPGRVLQGLVKRIHPAAHMQGADTSADIAVAAG